MAASTMGISSAGIESNPCASLAGAAAAWSSSSLVSRFGGEIALHSHIFTAD
jgi:hypothetical protein